MLFYNLIYCLVATTTVGLVTEELSLLQLHCFPVLSKALSRSAFVAQKVSFSFICLTHAATELLLCVIRSAILTLRLQIYKF